MIVEMYSYIKQNNVVIDVASDCIYAKKISSIQDYKKNRIYLNSDDVTNVLDEFLNAQNSTDIKSFIEKYGIIQGVENLSDIETRKSQKPPKKGYNPIGELSEYNKIKNNMNNIRINIFKIRLLSDFLAGNFDDADTEKIKALEEWIGESIDISNVEQYIFLEDYLEMALYDNINRYLEEINLCVVRDEKGRFFQTYEYPSLCALLYAKLAEEIAGKKVPQRCNSCGKWMTYRSGKIYCSECTKTKRKEKFLENADRDKEKIYAAVRDHFFTKCVRNNSNGYSINLDIFEYGEKLNSTKKLKVFYERWREQAVDIKKRSTDFCNDLDSLCREACSCKKCQAGLATYFKNKTEKKLQSE